jgi:hypothetical protein
MTYFVNFGIWARWKQDLAETLNNNAVGNFVSFLRRVGTHNIDIGWRIHKGSKLMGLSRSDLDSESIFKFLWFSRFAS